MSALGNGEGSKNQVLRVLLEERHPDVPSIAFNRLVTGQDYFFNAAFSRRRAHFSEEKIFCTLLYLNQVLLGLPPTDSVPLHPSERELYEPRLRVFNPQGVPLQIVEEEPLEASKGI